MKKLFAVIMVIAILSIVGYAQSLDEVVNGYLKAIGAKKLNAIKTMEAKAKMIDSRGMEVQMTYWLKRPNMVKAEILVGPQKITQAFDGKTAWGISPLSGSMDPQILPEDQAEQVKETFDMIDDPLVDYKKKGSALELLGKEEVEGKTYFKIKLTKKGNKVSTLFFDADTFLMHKISLIQNRGGMEYPMEIVFDDFRPVGGAKINHKVAANVNGQNIWNITFEYLKPDVKIDDAIFRMPESKEK